MEQMEKRDAYVGKLEARLDQWEADINKLKAKAAETSADAKIELSGRIEDLEQKTAKQRQKIRELRQAGEDTWDELTKGLESATNELEDTWKRVKSRLALANDSKP